jgi:hypothetical protein
VHLLVLIISEYVSDIFVHGPEILNQTDVETQTAPLPTQNPIWILNVCLLVLAVQYRFEGSGDPRLGRDPGFGDPLFKKQASFLFGNASSLLINKFKFWYFTISTGLKSILLRHSVWYLVSAIPEKLQMC